MNRAVFAAKFSERKLVFPSPIGPESKILFNRDPAERVKAVAPWLTTDTSVYPAIVNKRMVWIVDGYTTLDNYPYSELTSLSSVTADSNEVAFNRLAPDKQVSYIRNSVKATVDAYDGTVTLYAQDESDPVLQAWMKVFPGTVKPKSRHLPGTAVAPALSRGSVQGAARAAGEVPRQRSGDVLLDVGLLGCAAGSEPDGQQLSSRRTTSSRKTLRRTTNRRRSS